MGFSLVYSVFLLAFSFLLDQCLVLENPHAKISQHSQYGKPTTAQSETVLHAIILPSRGKEVQEWLSLGTFRKLNHLYFFVASWPLPVKPVLKNSSSCTYFLESPCFRGPPKAA